MRTKVKKKSADDMESFGLYIIYANQSICMNWEAIMFKRAWEKIMRSDC